MNTQRTEGAVLVMLLAVSAISAMLIVGVCCMVSGRYFKLNRNQAVHAGVVMLDDSARDGEFGAKSSGFLA